MASSAKSVVHSGVPYPHKTTSSRLCWRSLHCPAELLILGTEVISMLGEVHFRLTVNTLEHDFLPTSRLRLRSRSPSLKWASSPLNAHRTCQAHNQGLAPANELIAARSIQLCTSFHRETPLSLRRPIFMPFFFCHARLRTRESLPTCSRSLGLGTRHRCCDRYSV